MKKLIIIILILLPSFAFAGMQDAHKAVIARMNVAGSSCSVDNDKALDVPTVQPGTSTSANTWLARKFVLSAQKTITAYKILQTDNNNTGSIRTVLMAHDSVNNYPDETSEVSNSSVEVNASALPNLATVNDYVLATPLDVSSGTYWIVDQEQDGMSRSDRYIASSGDRSCSSSDGGSTWTCYDDLSYDMEIWGCD